MAATDGDVVVRVQALLHQPRIYRWRPSIALAWGAAACGLAAAVIAVRAHDLIELAEAVYAH